MTTPIKVKHRDGSLAPYNADMINRSIERACRGLTDPVSKVTQIATETELTLYDGITTEELDQATINAAVQNIKDDPEYDTIATRLLLKTIYKQVFGDYRADEELKQLHRDGFISYINKGASEGILDERLAASYDLNQIADALDITRDELFRYIGLVTIQKRYAIRGPRQELSETPQFTWMRVAMGLALPEKNPTEWAIKFYNKLSKLEYVSGGSTNVNAGTRLPQMSNCYLLEIHDSIDHIAKTVSDVMKLTKATGGIGLSVSKLRAEGSPVRSNNTFSSGPIPFMHTIDSTLRAVSRAGKKMGALCFYMENWHYNFDQFLDLKQNAGDEYRRTRTANTAAYISDEFMRRVERDEDWYLFDPAEVPDLNELYGNEFSRRYNDYIKQAEAGKLRLFKKIKAREQFKDIIISLQTTSHPWVTFKDAINVRALNNNTGTIHSSNLCTEVCLPQDGDNVAVCNLASVNLARHLTAAKDIDWVKLEESVRLAIRQLDNLLDVNKSPIPETRNSDKLNRAIGLGLMGWTDTIQQKGIAYDSEEAYELADCVFEFISYVAIDASANLARERGAYPNFSGLPRRQAGSRWSEGFVPCDTLKVLEPSRDLPLTVNKNMRLDWEALRQKVKQGMRNATVMAIAPTANIGLVSGTTPGLDPQFSNIFARATNRGKFLEINLNLINDLKKLGLWDKVKENIVANYGELPDIAELPDKIKRVYKTSFQIEPAAFIEVAARAQKWVDQAISRNMYLETRDIEQVMSIYQAGWRKGLKTFYYLHMKQRHTAEQSTARVNKSEGIANGRSFGFGKFKPISAAAPQPPAIEIPLPEPRPQTATPISVAQKMAEIMNALAPMPPLSEGEGKRVPPDSETSGVRVEDACPVDPMERLKCDSCQ